MGFFKCKGRERERDLTTWDKLIADQQDPGCLGSWQPGDSLLLGHQTLPLPKDHKALAKRKATWVSWCTCLLSGATVSVCCGLLFPWPDLTNYPQQNNWIFSKCYSVFASHHLQCTTGRLSNYYLYFKFCFLEIKLLGKNSESKEKKSYFGNTIIFF